MTTGDLPARETCRFCGEEQPLGQLSRGGLCYGCHLATYLPDWYQDAEQYARGVADNSGAPVSHPNATRRPRTGVPILDIDMRRLRVCETLLICRVRPRLR